MTSFFDFFFHIAKYWNSFFIIFNHEKLMYPIVLIWLIFFKFSLHRKVLKLWSIETFDWETSRAILPRMWLIFANGLALKFVFCAGHVATKCFQNYIITVWIAEKDLSSWKLLFGFSHGRMSLDIRLQYSERGKIFTKKLFSFLGTFRTGGVQFGMFKCI